MAQAPLPSDITKVDPSEAWAAWQPAAGQWNRKWAAHLFRRAAFGATDEQLRNAVADGLPKTLNTLMTGAPDAAVLLELFTEAGSHNSDAASLRAWWLYAMIEAGHPLREKLTLFWHNHFATSYAKVRSTKLMYQQNLTLRKHALGKFPAFLLDMSKDTAMLVWLDSTRNVKGAPNENYAREVMELFSLGVGNYTEKDIQEAARAFTGWHHDVEVKKFEFNRALHDSGEKTIFGKKGHWNGSDVVRLCCEQDACARFLVNKLYAFFVSEDATPKELLEPLADQFRKSGYDITGLVRTMLGSRLFFSAHAYQKRVKWPVEYTLCAVNSAVPGRVPLYDVVDPLAKMGQVLYAPPNVKGWRTGTDWLNSTTLLARNNFAEKVTLGTWSANRPRPNTQLFFAPEPSPAPNSSKQRPSPPPPNAKYDVCELVYAARPKDVSAVVRRLGELLFGQTVPAAVAKRLTIFLLTPAPISPSAKQTQPDKPSTSGDIGGAASGPVELEPVTKGAAKKGPKSEPPRKEPPPKPLDPKDVKIDSPEFKARVREAAHAMMCLPEYQLA